MKSTKPFCVIIFPVVSTIAKIWYQKTKLCDTFTFYLYISSDTFILQYSKSCIEYKATEYIYIYLVFVYESLLNVTQINWCFFYYIVCKPVEYFLFSLKNCYWMNYVKPMIYVLTMLSVTHKDLEHAVSFTCCMSTTLFINWIKSVWVLSPCFTDYT